MSVLKPNTARLAVDDGLSNNHLAYFLGQNPSAGLPAPYDNLLINAIVEVAMRFTGILKSWNDERGFGFIEPAQGGQEIFVHAKACRAGGLRPQVGQHLTFEVEVNAEGKKRARSVEPVRPARRRSAARTRGSPQWGTASYFAIPLFGLVYVAASIAWRVPGWVAGLYAVISIVALFAYGIDKSAATSDSRRISENTLLLLGLAGGWPGAIVAQQILRHKSSKQSFRSAFWGTVVMNVCAFVFLVSPYARLMLEL